MKRFRKVSAAVLLMATVAVVGACTVTTGTAGKSGGEAYATQHSSGFNRGGDFTP